MIVYNALWRCFSSLAWFTVNWSYTSIVHWSVATVILSCENPHFIMTIKSSIITGKERPVNSALIIPVWKSFFAEYSVGGNNTVHAHTQRLRVWIIIEEITKKKIMTNTNCLHFFSSRKLCFKNGFFRF